MARILIEPTKGETFNATSKARADVTAILQQEGFSLVPVRVSGDPRMGAQLRDLRSNRAVLRQTLEDAPEDSVLFFQYPWDAMDYGFSKLIRRYAQQKHLRTILLIHDITELRQEPGLGRTYYERVVQEYRFFANFDRVSCHNAAMKTHLVEHGVPAEKLVELGLFDYLLPTAPVPTADRFRRVSVAGNLSQLKAAYCYELPGLDNQSYSIDLYGLNYEGQTGDHLRYHGAFPPDELQGQINGGFGLVWDGGSLDACTGLYGEYQRVNNPHKLSLYLSCGVPAIVWAQAATADLVTQNGLGIAVESLRELEGFFAGLSPERYAEYLAAVREVQARLVRGDFTRAAVRTALA